MEETKLRIMIEQFFDAALTAEEERELCNYLSENDVPAELHKDKEMILALYHGSEETALPDGAELRLEAMIDTLAAESKQGASNENSMTGTRRHIINIPRTMRYAAAAIVIACLFTAEYWMPTTRQSNETAAFDTEKDTFNNPEEAMLCLKAAFNDISIAVNSTQNNLKEIEATLGATIKMSINKNNI